MKPNHSRSLRTTRDMVRRFWRHTRPPPRLVLASAGLRALQVPITIASPLLTQRLFDHALPGGRRSELLLLGAGLLLIALLSAASSQGHNVVAIRLRSQARARFTRRLMTHIARLPLSFFTARDSGYLTSRLREDLRTTERLLPDAILAALADVLRAACFFAILISLDAMLAAATLVLIGGLAFLVSRLTGPLSTHFHAALEASARSAASVQELISGLAVLRTLNAAERQARRSCTAQIAGIRADAGRDFLQMSTTNAIAASAQVGMALILLVGAYRMLAGEATFGTLVASFVALSQLISASDAVFSFVPGFLGGLAGLERMYRILDQAPEATFTNAPFTSALAPATTATATGRLELDRVGFAYDAGVPVLHEVSFHIEPGEIVALVGPSGAGKSTIAHLLTRLYEPTNGTIRLDGRPLQAYQVAWLRRQIGLVSQQVFLVNGTVRDNLVLGCPGASEAAIRQAARQAAADRFIQHLPAGYDTQVGEDGARLSGGQRQRLALARELLRAPRVLILDEATSNLDANSEARIRQGISNLMRGRTCIVIAHRATTVRMAHRVLVLDGGRLVAHGTHEELSRHSALYRQLFTQPGSRSGVGHLDRVEIEVEPPTRDTPEVVEAGAVIGGTAAGAAGQHR